MTSRWVNGWMDGGMSETSSYQDNLRFVFAGVDAQSVNEPASVPRSRFQAASLVFGFSANGNSTFGHFLAKRGSALVVPLSAYQTAEALCQLRGVLTVRR